jgi:tetratricopeptide (TPR) repeat protein
LGLVLGVLFNFVTKKYMFYKLCIINNVLNNFVFSLLILFFVLSNGCKLPHTFNPLTATRLRSIELEHLGNTALERGDNKTAEKYFSDALRLNRRDVDLRRSYAESLWQQGKNTDAIEQLKYAQKHGGGQNDVNLNISLAEKLLCMNNIDDAYKQADEAVRLSPQDSRGWALRGKASMMYVQNQLNSPVMKMDITNVKPEDIKNIDQVKEKIRERIINSRNDYYRAISMDPSNRNILADLAEIQLLAGQPEHSLITLQNLQEQYPPESIPSHILQCKAKVYFALKKYDEANQCIAIANEKIKRK